MWSSRTFIPVVRERAGSTASNAAQPKLCVSFLTISTCAVSAFDLPDTSTPRTVVPASKLAIPDSTFSGNWDGPGSLRGMANARLGTSLLTSLLLSQEIAIKHNCVAGVDVTRCSAELRFTEKEFYVGGGRPIDNRPQVGNLSHRTRSAESWQLEQIVIVNFGRITYSCRHVLL